MLKRLLVILLLLPLTVTAVPTSVPVNKLQFDHDGLLTSSYNIYCNGNLVLNIPGNTTRVFPIIDAATTNGNYICYVTAVATTGGYESVKSDNLSFFIQGGQPMITVEVPAAPSNFRAIP